MKRRGLKNRKEKTGGHGQKDGMGKEGIDRKEKRT
jgi:hypothetical protein